MTQDNLQWDEIITPLKLLMACALEHASLFETEAPRLARLTMPCTLPVERARPLRTLRPAHRARVLEVAADGYARALSPISSLFDDIPPVLAVRPFRLSIGFSAWEPAPHDPEHMLPVEVGALAASAGGANFMAATPSALVWSIGGYLSTHAGLKMQGELQPWTFEAPEMSGMAEHIEPYQGLLADTARNAIARLASLSNPIRLFLRDGGEITAAHAVAARGMPARRPILRV